MTIWSENQLNQALKEILIDKKVDQNSKYEEVIIDSRKVTKNSIFLALKGENNDGHDFLPSAFTNGAKLAIIDRNDVFEKYKNQFSLILVQDSLQALVWLAKFKRKNSHAKFIAVTGSAGKTSVKEMLKLIFESQGKTYATSGNLNNHIGMPLTLANMPQDTDFAILEMGMNHLNEIAPLSQLAKPDIAIITNVAPAHIGNFKNEEEIALAKSEIFSGLSNQGFAIVNRDNIHFEFLKNRAQNFYKIDPKNILTFGKNDEATYKLKNVTIIDAWKSLVTVIFSTPHKTINTPHPNPLPQGEREFHQEISYEILSSNKTTAFNSLIACCCLDLLKCDLEKGLSALKNISSIEGRGNIIEIKKDGKNITIIDDSYNANLASIAAGIEYLSDLKIALNKKRSVAILGDMLELGKDSARLHKEIAKYLAKFRIDFAFLVGKEMEFLAQELENKNCQLFTDSSLLAKEIFKLLNDGDIALVKGSRGIRMENVINELKK